MAGDAVASGRELGRWIAAARRGAVAGDQLRTSNYACPEFGWQVVEPYA